MNHRITIFTAIIFLFITPALGAQDIVRYANSYSKDGAAAEFMFKKFASKDEVNKYYNTLDATQRHILCSVNRMDSSRLLQRQSIWLPMVFDKSMLYYAPFEQQLASIDTIPKLIIISLKLQAIALYEYGRLVRWGAVCTGKKGTPTPTGLHYMTFKKRLKTSTINRSWIMPWYFNIDVKRGIALHQYGLPGQPSSHGCIRMLEADARYIYSWGNQWQYRGNSLYKKGTPVLIFDNYNFDTNNHAYMFENNRSAAAMQELQKQLDEL